MHNTHLLGHDRQLSQTYFTHLTLILTLHNQPPTVNRQWPPLRWSHMSRHTRFNTSRKTDTAMMHSIFLGTNTVYRSIRPSINPTLYLYYVEIRVIWNAIRESPRSSCNFGETRLRMHEAISVSCQAALWFGWFQTKNPSCAALRVWFDSFIT